MIFLRFSLLFTVIVSNAFAETEELMCVDLLNSAEWRKVISHHDNFANCTSVLTIPVNHPVGIASRSSNGIAHDILVYELDDFGGGQLIDVDFNSGSSTNYVETNYVETNSEHRKLAFRVHPKSHLDSTMMLRARLISLDEISSLHIHLELVPEPSTPELPCPIGTPAAECFNEN